MEASPDCWANHWYNPPHSPRTVLIQSEKKGLAKSLWTPHIPAHSFFELFKGLVDATELWAPERPDTETVSSLRQSSHEHLTLNLEHTTQLYNYLFTTYTYFFHFKFARQTCTHNCLYCILCFCHFVHCLFVYCYFVSCPVSVILLHCGASVTITNSLYV